MSKQRNRYRRMVRKTSASNTPAHGRQGAASFFDFGGMHGFFSGKSPEAAISRKCDGCDKEDKVQKKEGAAGGAASPHASSQIKSLHGGAFLPNATRSFFEPKFAADFSQVRIHNSSDSHELASSVSAKAFTYKNNIVFSKGAYDTESSKGKQLLAHELTHVVKQNPGISKKESEKKEEEKVQRVPATKDFKIKGLDPASSGDDSIIRFDVGESSIADSEAAKVKRQAKSNKTVELNLNGFTSEEGLPDENKKLANARINQVDNVLSAFGHTGVRHKKPDTGAGEGNSNYRSRRVVEITPSFIAPGVPTPSAIDSCTIKYLPCNLSLFGIVPLSMEKVIKAITALNAPDPAASLQLSTFFGATPAATVQVNLGSLLGEIAGLTLAHDPATDCHKDACDDTCSKGAAAYVDRGLTPAKMVFCESILSASDAERSETFIHEALHATPGLLTEDIAYAHTRKILTLTDAEKLKNTDSYVMLIRMLHDPKAVPTAPPKDAINGTTTAGEEDFARKAIAFLEQWLITSKFLSGQLYGEINNGIINPAGWKTPLGWYHEVMHNISPIFGLTDPGTTDPFDVPKRDDKIRVAGLGDRYHRMREVLHSAPISLNKIGSGPENWAKELGNKVNVQPSFFSKSDTEAIRHLILLMAKSMGDVPSSLRGAYVDGADKMRKQSNVGP